MSQRESLFKKGYQMDQNQPNNSSLKREHNSADKIRENLYKLFSETEEKRKKLKSTQQTISKLMIEEEKRQKRIKEKLYLVQERREKEQLLKAFKLQEQIGNVEKRLEQRKLELSQKKEQPSIKDMFIKQKGKEELEKTLRKYELYNYKNPKNQSNEDSVDNNITAQNVESLFFNLTAPAVQTESMAEKVMLRMKQQLPHKKANKDKQKQQINPFYNKQNWERFMEAERNGESNIRFPGIGIERTPLYQIQQEEIEKNKKKEESLQNLKKYYLNPQKKKAIDFDSIYKRVKSITSQSLALLKVDPSDTLLGHMMDRSVVDARRIWGKDFLRSKSQNDFGDRVFDNHHLSSIKEDPITSDRGQNSDLTREKINSLSKINSSNPNNSVLRQQQEETQMQSILNQQAENSLSIPDDYQNESLNTRREKLFKENILQSDSKI